MSNSEPEIELLEPPPAESTIDADNVLHGASAGSRTSTSSDARPGILDLVPDATSATSKEVRSTQPSHPSAMSYNPENTRASNLNVEQLPQIVLILVGFVGSGKSSFAQALQLHFPQFLRCNQDELGNRRRVEEAARQHLQTGGSVCIDRTNIDASQRETWIRLARSFPGALAWVLLIDTPFPVCEERLRNRVEHPTITSVEQGLAVLHRFRSQYEPPHPNEGYDQFLRLPVSQQPSGPVYTKHDVVEVINRLQSSPRTAPTNWGQSVVTRGNSPSRLTQSMRGRFTTARGGYDGYNRQRGGFGSYRGRPSGGYRTNNHPYGAEQPRRGYSAGSRSEGPWRRGASSNDAA